MRVYFSLAFLIALVGLSSYSTFFKQEDFVWVKPVLPDRAPASLKSLFQGPESLDQPLKLLKQKKSLEKIRLQTSTAGVLLFDMEQFAVAVKNDWNWLCLEYGGVQLKMEADGSQVGSSKPQVVVSAPCLFKEDAPNELKTIPIPLKVFIDSKKPAVEFEYYDVKGQIAWETSLAEGLPTPKFWALTEIQFVSPVGTKKEKLTVSSRELSSLLSADQRVIQLF